MRCVQGTKSVGSGNRFRLGSRPRNTTERVKAETIAATSILSEAVFLKGLLERILGIEPKLVMYSDSSSSRQLIARKGLGKARHLDVDLLWIQRSKVW